MIYSLRWSGEIESELGSRLCFTPQVKYLSYMRVWDLWSSQSSRAGRCRKGPPTAATSEGRWNNRWVQTPATRSPHKTLKQTRENVTDRFWNRDRMFWGQSKGYIVWIMKKSQYWHFNPKLHHVVKWCILLKYWKIKND